MPVFDATPFVKGKPLSERRVSILSTAALQKRDDKVFSRGEASYRIIPGDTAPEDIIMSHNSVNFDRSGFHPYSYRSSFPRTRLRSPQGRRFQTVPKTAPTPTDIGTV